METQNRQANHAIPSAVKSHPAYPCLVVLLFALCGIPVFSATNASLAVDYARIYERELVGEYSGLVQDYQRLFEVAREGDKELAEKCLFRMGFCEKRAGQKERARLTWRTLVETFPLSDPIVASARDLLKGLEWEMDRVMIAGRVYTPLGITNSSATCKSIIFAGEWGNEPPVITGDDGGFRVGRKPAGKLPDGLSYGLIYAEHVSQQLAGVELWVGAQTTGVTVALTVPLVLSGRVFDRSGNPVGGARVHITGYKNSSVYSSGGESGKVARTEYSVPFPIDRLMPPVYACTNGTFVVDRLPSGLRYELVTETPEYHVVLNDGNSIVTNANTGSIDYSQGFSVQQLSNRFANLVWLRGNLDTGVPFRWSEFLGKVVVFHFGSAYGEASLRLQYVDEGSGLSRLLELYGEQGLLCIWILPEGEERGEAGQLALAYYPDLPVGVERGPRGEQRETQSENQGMGINVVLGRDGCIQTFCSDQQLFKSVKKALEK